MRIYNRAEVEWRRIFLSSLADVDFYFEGIVLTPELENLLRYIV